MQGDGGGGTLRIAHGAEGEASIGFYRYSDLRSAQAGDGWVLGVDSYGAGAGNLGLGTPERNLVWVIRKDGSAGLGPISATSVATPSFTGGTGSFRSVLAQEGTFLTARVAGLLSSDTASSSRVIANRITATGPFGGVEAQQGAIQTLVAGSLTLGSMSAGPSGATFRAPVTFTGPVTANYIGSEQIAADALLSNSLSVVGALDVGANGSIVRTPLGIQGSTTLTGSFRCYGTGTIDNLSAANATPLRRDAQRPAPGRDARIAPDARQVHDTRLGARAAVLPPRPVDRASARPRPEADRRFVHQRVQR
jgi:hypothetical protein